MADDQDEQNVNVDTGQPATPIVDWDDSEMRSSYANVVNVSSTREEVNLFFGTNQTWKAPADRKFHVRLSERIALNPYAAKRLWLLLGAVLKEYEKRFGTLHIDTGVGTKTPGSTQVQ
jgi:hypothetical protein